MAGAVEEALQRRAQPISRRYRNERASEKTNCVENLISGAGAPFNVTRKMKAGARGMLVKDHYPGNSQP